MEDLQILFYITIKDNGYSPTVFVIPEKSNYIKDYKFRKEIKEKVGENVYIFNKFYEENKDIDEYSKISVDFINDISKKIYEKTQGNMVDLFIARKVIKFNPDYSQEIKYKKFLLINTLLAFKCLSNGGNFIIKLYDTFTPFTIGIYMIFKNFESVSVFKPVSTRQYSSSRFLVAEKYLKETEQTTNNSIKYLEDFVTKYIEYSSNNIFDVKNFLPNSELRNNDNFLKIIREINNGITEKRIDALKEIINHMNNLNTKLYDKMLIRKFFLNNWGVPVIFFDESFLLRNQLKNKGGNNYQSKKIYSQTELVEMYGNAGTLDKNQEKLLEMLSGNKQKKVKKISKEKEKEKEKEKQKSLDEKYSILENKVFGKKKNYSSQNRDKKIINKKRERTNDDKNNKNNSETKNKDKNKKNKKEDKKDELVDFNTDEENDLFKITPNVKKN